MSDTIPIFLHNHHVCNYHMNNTSYRIFGYIYGFSTKFYMITMFLFYSLQESYNNKSCIVLVYLLPHILGPNTKWHWCCPNSEVRGSPFLYY